MTQTRKGTTFFPPRGLRQKFNSVLFLAFYKGAILLRKVLSAPFCPIYSTLSRTFTARKNQSVRCALPAQLLPGCWKAWRLRLAKIVSHLSWVSSLFNPFFFPNIKKKKKINTSAAPKERWPHGQFMKRIKEMGAKLEMKDVTEIAVDKDYKVISTPAWLCEQATYAEVHEGIGNLVKMLKKCMNHWYVGYCLWKLLKWTTLFVVAIFHVCTFFIFIYLRAFDRQSLLFFFFCTNLCN